MTQPMYKQALNIRCAAAHCSQIVKSDGVTICDHTVLGHKFSRGETIVLCRLCAKRADVTQGFVGEKNDWEILREVLRDSQKVKP